MGPDEAPCTATQRVELPLAVTGCLRDNSHHLQGGVLSDTKFAWLSKGPIFEVIDTSDGAKIAAWTFGAVVRDFKTKVTCVSELPQLRDVGAPAQGSISQLLVGLECELTGGMLCTFNLAGSRVLRAVNVPSKVTAISVVSSGSNDISPFHQSMNGMSGIAAVGTNSGQIFLIDLRRRECAEALRIGPITHWESTRDELRPCALLSLKSPNFYQRLQDCPDDHPCLLLNEKAFLNHQRLVVKFSGADYEPFMPEHPSVTSLLYVPRLASLCVGFGFGSFQIWSLQTLTHVYTLPVEEPSPVVGLAFQEACDDPNAYCYLWAVRGSSASGSVPGSLENPVPAYGPPTAVMYSLCYDEKIWVHEYGHLYRNFMMCSVGFEYDMGGEEGSGTVGGRLVSLCSVSRAAQQQAASCGQPNSEDSSAMGSASNTISLCLLVWETWGPCGPQLSVDPRNIHMALFDLNQWYVDHMPGQISVRGGPSRNKVVASYMVSFNVGGAFGPDCGLLVDVGINYDTLLQFSSVQNVEEHSKPASLSFESLALLERQVVRVKHPGVQRALLSSLMAAGPTALISPSNLFHECLALGLKPLLMDIPSTMNIPVEEQRTLILCVALEHRLGKFLCRCAREWVDGRLCAAGCTLSWLLSVMWNRAATLKQFAVRLCVQLFDYSGEKLDSNAQRQLRHIVGLLHVLETLFQSVVRNKWHLSLTDWQQVELQSGALLLECQYYDVLQWFIDVELLPEAQSPNIPYPALEIAHFYQTRRTELERLLQQSETIEDLPDVLLIDGILSNQPEGSRVCADWERDAGSQFRVGAGLYPPSSLQALLRTYLVKGVSLEAKNSIVIYVLMDLADVLDSEKHQSAFCRFMQFPAAFRMSLGAMRLTQAFWHLDHKSFEVAVDMLLDPLVSVNDMQPWQHRAVVRLLLLQGQPRLALRYMRNRRPAMKDESDIRTQLSLLLANNLIHEAFMYQRSHRSNNVDKFLEHFFKGCEERNQLKTILQFSLDSEEEAAFSRYLETCRHPAADDLRVLYLLKRSRYVEALDVNQELKKKGRSASTRDIVVNALYKTLPSVTRTLASHCAQQRHRLESWKRVERPTPLYVNVKMSSPTLRYKSSLLDAAVEKSRETWSKLVDNLPTASSTIEGTPFLCTPRAKVHSVSRARPPTVTLNKEAEPNNRKRYREGEEMDGFSPVHSKRSRLLDWEKSASECKTSPSARRSTYSCVDTVPLLNTPVVQRRSPAARAKLQQQLLAGSTGHSIRTPHSIIKVRQMVDAVTPESLNRRRVFIAKSIIEPELTEEESESEPFPSPVAAQGSLSKGESDTESETDEVTEEPLERASARRAIEFGSDSSSQESMVLETTTNDSYLLPSCSPSPVKTPAVASSRHSLSRMVVLSEARKASMQGASPRKHSVTFGKGSVCIYDQDEPVDSEVALHDESSRESEDVEGSFEVHDIIGNQDVLEREESDLVDEGTCSREDEVPFEEEGTGINDDDVAVEVVNVANKSELPSDKHHFRASRLDTSGIGTMTASLIEEDLSRSEENEVFFSAEYTSGTLNSPTFRKSLARPSIREITRRLSAEKRVPETGLEQERSKSPCYDTRAIEQQDASENAYHQDIDITGNLLQDPTGSTSSSVHEEHFAFSSGNLARLPTKTIACLSMGIDLSTENIHNKDEDSLSSHSTPGHESTANVLQQKTTTMGIDLSTENIHYKDEDSLSSHSTPGHESTANVLQQKTTTFEHDSRREESTIEELESCSSTDVVLTKHSVVGKDSEIMECIDISDAESSDTGNGKASSEDDDMNADIVEYEDGFLEDNSNIFRTSLLSHSGMYFSGQDSLMTDDGVQEDDVVITDLSAAVPTSSGLVLEESKEPSCTTVEDRKTIETLDVAELETGVEATCEASSKDSNLPNGECELYKESSSISRGYSSDLGSHSSPGKISELNKVVCESESGEMENVDDMPTLRLEACGFESPRDVSSLSPVKSPKESVCFIGEPVPKPQTPLQSDPDCSTQVPECRSPSPKSVEVESPSNVSEKFEKPRSRASSISSVNSAASSEHVQTRKVTRSSLSVSTPEKVTQIKHQKVTQIKHQTRRASVSETESVSLSEESEHFADVDTSKSLRRSRRLSQSGQESENVAKKPATPVKRTRRSSVKSIEEVENSPAPDLASSAYDDSDKILQEKLARISEDDSTSEISGTGTGNKKTSGADSPLRKAPRRRKISELDVTVAKDQQSVKGSSVIATDPAITEYETSRRLTRHQRALLARSMEFTKPENMFLQRAGVSPKSNEDEDQAASSDDDKASQISVRSSLRLRLKREKEIAGHASPSSTASTVINPALSEGARTPSRRSRRRQSLSDAPEMNQDTSPASSEVRSRRSLQPPGTPTRVPTVITPTRRSTRRSNMTSSSARQSEDGDNQSVASLSPSSVASGKKRGRRLSSQRLSESSDAPTEQFAFSSPALEVAASADCDVSMTESFTFSPPKNVATPSKAKSLSSDPASSAKKVTRRSRLKALQTITEESSGRVSQEETLSALDSPASRTRNRHSWFFIDPVSEEEKAKAAKREEELLAKQRQEAAKEKPKVYSAFARRKEYPVVPLPENVSGEEESDSSGDREAIPEQRRQLRHASRNQKK